MVEIRSKEQFAHWVKTSPTERAVVISARSCVRTIPALGRDLKLLSSVASWPNLIVLPIFRGCFVSVAASKYHDADLKVPSILARDAAYEVAGQFRKLGGQGIASTSYVAARSSRAVVYRNKDEAATRAAIVDAVASPSYIFDLWENVQADTESVSKGFNPWLKPCWNGDWFSRAHNDWSLLCDTLLWTDPYWSTLCEWVRDRLFGDEAVQRLGRPSIREMDLEIANLSDEIWSDAKMANEAIAEIQNRYWNQQPPQPEPSLFIPPQCPAALEPIWVDDQLKLVSDAANANLPREPLAASLGALRSKLEHLVVEARKVGNIDQRLVDDFEHIASHVPSEAPDQRHLFELGHDYEFMAAAQSTISEEWPDRLSARYASTLLAFERTVKQFPNWKLFVQNASALTLSQEEIAVAPDLIADFAKELRQPDMAPIVAEEVPEALEALVKPMLDGSLDVVPEGRIIDSIESSSNILKRLLEPVFDGYDEGKSQNGLRFEVGKSLGEEATRLAQNAGSATTKFLKSILTSKVTRTGATCVAGIWTLQQFQWLKALKPMLEKLLAP